METLQNQPDSTLDGRSPQAMPTNGFWQLPIARIRPNAHNPRQIIKPGAVETMASSLKSIGQETPIKARSLTAEEKQTDSNHDYELIGGHIRLAAAQQLGWEHLDALVMDIPQDKPALAAFMDNQGEDMHWMDWYQAIELRLHNNPNLTHKS